MRLSLEALPHGERDAEVYVYLDEAGRQRLIRALQRLEFPRNDHEHLHSEEWAGDELTVEQTQATSLRVHHLKIFLRPEGEDLFEP